MKRKAPILGVGGAVVEKRDGELCVCLIRRGSAPGKGSWSLPGGRVESGEKLLDAVRRELREETGLEVTVGPLVEVAEIFEGEDHYVVLDYACSVRGGELRAGDDAVEAVWVSVAELGVYGVSQGVERVARGALTLLRGRV